MPIHFEKDFRPEYGKAVRLADGIHRMTVNNPSPFTFHGTNSYLIGQDSLAIIDPGPDNESHYDALLQFIDGRPVSHILITHCHMDHSPLARRLAKKLKAPIVAEGPYRPARPLLANEDNRLDAGSETDFSPDICVKHGEYIEASEWHIEVVATPGHMATHLCFGLKGHDILFSGDHVMAWATTVIAPPDGSMQDYMHSLDILLERDDKVYLPGHGAPVTKTKAFVRGLKAHRKMRERAILERLQQGDHTIEAMVASIYRDTDPRLHKAAGLSIFAHMEDLIIRKLVKTQGDARIDSDYSLS